METPGSILGNPAAVVGNLDFGHAFDHLQRFNALAKLFDGQELDARILTTETLRDERRHWLNQLLARLMDAGKFILARLESKEWHGDWLRVSARVLMRDV